MLVSNLVKTLLEKRGITDPNNIDVFLNPDYERDTHDPQLFIGMEHAVSRFFAALQNSERIAVYADFDCDGIPGAALFSDFFKKIGYKNYAVYIPHRDREGYGFHKAAIDTLSREKVSLIITVDVGTSAREAVAYAKEAGIDTIVTDHHELPDILPEAVVILNPKINPPTGGYPFPDLCGSAVAWKFVVALLREGKRRRLPEFTAVPDGWEKWLLDLVAIATIADMVPLVGENRALAHFGLRVLRKSPRKGIRALVSLLRLHQSELTEDDIGFSIAPRINAASRMDEPELAFRLLSTESEDEAIHLAEKLEHLNSSRKGVVGAMVREAKQKVRARFGTEERVVVTGNTEWKPALLGLAANSILGEREGVVCLWGRDANGNLKGSCRSDGSISIMELFKNAHDILAEYGGHRASGGFSVSAENIHTLHEALARAASGIAPLTSEEKRLWDARVSLSEISFSLFTELSLLAPFGVGNPKPLLCISGSRILATKKFGKNREHIEITLLCETSGRKVRSFQFFKTPESFSAPFAIGEAKPVIATLERDTYRGSQALALRLVDIIPS